VCEAHGTGEGEKGIYKKFIRRGVKEIWLFIGCGGSGRAGLVNFERTEKSGKALGEGANSWVAGVSGSGLGR